MHPWWVSSFLQLTLTLYVLFISLWNASFYYILFFRPAAELVVWNPIGSQYALAVGSKMVVYNLEVCM